MQGPKSRAPYDAQEQGSATLANAIEVEAKLELEAKKASHVAIYIHI